MIRTLNTIMVAATVLLLVAVYAQKYRAEEIASENARLETEIDRKVERLTGLKADWAYLNQPSAIEPIVVRHAEALGLAPVDGKQFASIEDIPMRPATDINSDALEALLLSLDEGVDPGNPEVLEIQ
ncbi:cell division protein FtsL [Cucumibacter marinus]|uniref:cell division protein FtsL n=1 Tax=Cucumibacter marinus TaxID=1121252 RepID=UPI00041ADEF9|nr:hypothetical protein [Cucumibacter marinus]